MAPSNLTPERKAKLKKEILDEIGKKDISPKSKQKKSAVLGVSKKITPKVEPIDPIKTKTIKPKVKKVVKKTKPVIKKKTKNLDNSSYISDEQIKNTKKNKATKSLSKKKPSTIKKIVQPKKVVIKSPEPNIKQNKELLEKELLFKSDSLVAQIPKPKDIYSNKPSKGNKKMFFLGILTFVVTIIIVLLMVSILGIYKFGWSGGGCQLVAKTLSLPAGSINGEQIKLSDYFNDFNIVNEIIESSDNSDLNIDDIKDQLFNRLVSMTIIENELKRYGQSITKEMVDTEMQKIISNTGSEEAVINEIKNLYGMDIELFKKSVLEPLIATNILKSIILDDEELDINIEAKLRAEEALSIALVPGVDFGSLVLQFSNDPSVIDAVGDLGWFSRGELSPELEDTLFSLSAGTVYDQIIKDSFGYHIFKVDNKLIDEDTERESIKISQILITIDPEMYVKSLLDDAKIKKYIK